MAVAERARPATKRPPGGSDINLWTWFFMRISGIVLLFLVLGHFTIVHLMGGGINRVNFAFVSGRWSSPFWQTWDWTMLFLGMLHGANGMKVIIDDYVRRPGARVALKSTLYVMTFVLILLGTLIILTFDPTKGRSAVLGGIAG
ncbi:MAG: succinate dehydrogenase hydrophobic membrane anchor subunit [Actinomycetota bacterium]|nr:succinate dehydrogenase hydrophobic membrane anchor subunit [Actinomycetota bacterium]